MILSRKIELKPNNKQKTMFRQHCGVARWTWNWGLRCCIDANEQRKLERAENGKAFTKFPSAFDLHNRLVAEVKPAYPWFYECSKCAPQQALRDLECAFKRRFKVPGTGFPKFKKKGNKTSFYTGPARSSTNKVKLPRIGWVRCKENIPPECKLKAVTISERAGRWFMAFKMEIPDASPTTETSVVGIDLGVKTFATLSDGEQFTIPKQRELQKKLVKCQRQMSRRKKGSGRRQRSKNRIGKIYYRISNVRKDATHKLTNHTAKNHGVIVIEDLCVSGMMKNHCLAASVAASNFFEVRRQLGYKTVRYGSQLVVVDRFFPSSQICSGCGHRQKMPLQVRQYDCPSCGLSLDRDVNAARNLAASSAVTARWNPEVHAERQVPELPREIGSGATLFD